MPDSAATEVGQWLLSIDHAAQLAAKDEEITTYKKLAIDAKRNVKKAAEDLRTHKKKAAEWKDKHDDMAELAAKAQSQTQDRHAQYTEGRRGDAAVRLKLEKSQRENSALREQLALVRILIRTKPHYTVLVLC